MFRQQFMTGRRGPWTRTSARLPEAFIPVDPAGTGQAEEKTEASVLDFGILHIQSKKAAQSAYS